MKLALILALISFSAFAKVDQTKGLRTVQQHVNSEPSAFVYASPSATYRVATADSFDPFTSKTNKYAESKAISVISSAAILAKFGASTITPIASTDAGVFIPANTRQVIGIDADYPYMRIISTTGSSATVFVTELY